MTRYLTALALAAAGVIVITSGAFALEHGKPAPAFQLEDQFGKGWSLSDLSGSVVVVVAASPKSGEAMGPWVDNMKSKYSSKIQLLGLMQLDDLPGIIRGMAKSRIRKETKDPLMLDFSGATAKAYEVSDKHPVVVVIDKDGIVRSVQATKYTDDAFDKACSAISKALRSS